MNAHVIKLHEQLIDLGFTNDQIVFMCDHFHGKLNQENKETYADLKLYSADIVEKPKSSDDGRITN